MQRSFTVSTSLVDVALDKAEVVDVGAELVDVDMVAECETGSVLSDVALVTVPGVAAVLAASVPVPSWALAWGP